MTIKIRSLYLQKDKITSTTHTQFESINNVVKLDGELKVNMSEGIVKGDGEVHVTKISKKLQDKLYSVLSEIEDELNGTKEMFTSAGEDTGRPEVKEKEVEKDEKDELEQFENMLGNIVKTFGSTINVGVKTKLTSQEISGILKELKTKGFNLL